MVEDPFENVIEKKKKKLKDNIKEEKYVVCVTECGWDGVILCCELYTYYESLNIVKQECRKYIWLPSLQEFKQVICEKV